MRIRKKKIYLLYNMSFNVFLNSANGTKETFYSSEVLFNFDWTNTPEHHGKYKVYMNFTTTSSASMTPNPYSIATVTSNISATQSSYSPNNTTTSPGTSGNNFILGFIMPIPVGDVNNSATENYLGCNYTTNPPVIIQSKPTNSNFTIKLFNVVNARFLSIQNTDYFLNLYFEAIP